MIGVVDASQEEEEEQKIQQEKEKGKGREGCSSTIVCITVLLRRIRDSCTPPEWSGNAWTALLNQKVAEAVLNDVIYM